MPSFPNPNANLTFGIEFEFMSTAPASQASLMPWKLSEATRVHLAQLMARKTSLPIACRCHHAKDSSSCTVCDKIPKNQMHDDLRIFSPSKGTNKDLKTNFFIFCLEYLRPFEGINATRHWPGIEMMTPAFKYGELASGLPTVKTAISGLRNMGVQITADDTCGLHVHVGVESGMTQLIAKKAISLVMLLEHTLLYPLVAPSRLSSECARSVTELSNAGRKKTVKGDVRLKKVEGQRKSEPVAMYIPPMKAIKPGKWAYQEEIDALYQILQIIWNAESLQELDLLVQRVIYTRAALAICLRNREFELAQSWDFSSLENSPTTIEFRYAQMSFDETFIHNWVQLVCRIVEIAQLDAKEYREIVSKILLTLDGMKEDEESIWESLLPILHLKHQVKDWKSQLKQYKSGVEIAHLDGQLLLMSEVDEAKQSKKGGKA